METTILVPTPLYLSASSHSNPESIAEAEAEADANADYEEGGALVLPPEGAHSLTSAAINPTAETTGYTCTSYRTFQ
ncbi:hypothetical protein OsI_02114 [Oryza sativa Indica Group]|uniref:Uncharacterized protein n=2 Tax=Oryza sativa TaxID=4530 RepID=A2ZTL6_ORYSJ|nr:hypothetical protein OsI_02114 [Oryza sativa Indica Group]EAZ12063.1 hypothetical protein OsJ_01946 [Oryza sativa Japonica Group]